MLIKELWDSWESVNEHKDWLCLIDKKRKQRNRWLNNIDIKWNTKHDCIDIDADTGKDYLTLHDVMCELEYIQNKLFNYSDIATKFMEHTTNPHLDTYESSEQYDDSAQVASDEEIIKLLYGD